MGDAGIGIVRMSGPDAVWTAGRVFRAADGASISSFRAFTVHYGWVVECGEIVDEVLLTLMRAPRSYTREDVVEISCHGGVVAVRRVLELLLRHGVRQAEPGEFTQRAFLNGRIDLAQAESVAEVIRAKTDYALKMGMCALSGGLGKRINRIRGGLLEALSVLETQIDFAEEQAGAVDLNGVGTILEKAHRDIGGLLQAGAMSAVIRDGVRVIICGRTNVGKSSLLNALLKVERSIVTHLAGTTRDTVEEIIDMRGIPVRITDTAGMLTPRDIIERKAMQRLRHTLSAADFVLLVFDGSRPLDSDDERLIRRLRRRPVIAVINKSDRPERVARKRIERLFPVVVTLSAKRMENIDMLEEAVVNQVYLGKAQGEMTALSINQRQTGFLRQARRCVSAARRSLQRNFSAEFVAHDVKEALRAFDRLLGKEFSADLLERIFADFCIGK